MNTPCHLEFTGACEVRLVEDAEIPRPGPGEIGFRTTRTMISTGTEGIVYARKFSPGTHWDRWVKYPFRPGYMSCGVVESVGEGVTGWEPGMRVVARTTHASHAVAATTGVWPIPDNVSDEAACAMGMAKITQVGVRAAEHTLGDAVVVVGLGLLGQFVVQYAVLSGARTVIAIDPSPGRLKHLDPALGVHAFAGPASEARDLVFRLTNGVGADVVYDVTGHHAVFSTVLPLARELGKVILLGDTGHPELQTLTADVVRRGLRIIGVHDAHGYPTAIHAWEWTGPRMEQLFLHYLSRGQMRVEHMITHRFRPEQAAECYEMLRLQRDDAMCVYFVWD